jgi:decaprenylphospho-beta-D-ribofuranose 2-oxidase
LRERRIGSLAEFMDAFEESDATYSVGWIDALARGAEMGRGVLEEAEIAAEYRPRRDKGRRAVPFEAPRFALSGPVVRAFNAMYWRRIPESGRSRKTGLTRFLFPLDAISDWNRLYGARGFHQFQCVVPMAARDAVRDLLEMVTDSGRASPLAVLKKLGPGRAGMLSFPMAGWTLAVDMAARKGVEDLFAQLEDVTLTAGGRIYLAKDALARPASLAAMYPELPDFRKVAAEMDPGGRFGSDLGRRLGVRT